MTSENLSLPRFHDREGRIWDVDINVPVIARVRKLVGINLLELALPDNDLAERLDDPILLVDTLYAICKEQADSRSVSDEAFGKALSRDAIDDAWLAVIQGVINFSPRGVRPAFQKVLEKTVKLREIQNQRAIDAAASPELEAMIEAKLAEYMTAPPQSPSASSNTAGSSPESSESIRTA